MVISGVLVVSAPEHMKEVQAALDARPWLEVHHTEADGRMVVSLEARDTDESIARLREIQELPRVILAEMSEYYVGDE